MINYSLIICLFFLVISCATADKKNPDAENGKANYALSAGKYMPLKEGNTWTYAIEFMGQKGAMDISIVEKTKDGWFRDNRGSMMKIDNRGVRDRDRYLLLFPLDDKQSWMSIIDPRHKEEKFIVDIDRSVVVPAGSFEGAVVVQSVTVIDENNFLHTYHYFVADVGIVKIETFVVDKHNKKVVRQTRTELSSYKLN